MSLTLSIHIKISFVYSVIKLCELTITVFCNKSEVMSEKTAVLYSKPTSCNERHLSARLYGQSHFRVSLAAQRGYLITVWIEADIAWLTHSPESIISLMKPQRSEKTGFVIDDAASEPPEYEHAISYSWFTARSSSHFESSVIFFFSSLALLFSFLTCGCMWTVLITHRGPNSIFCWQRQREAGIRKGREWKW